MAQPSHDTIADAPFYIEDGCCLLCGVPEAIAPELFETTEIACRFIRQPATSAEIDKTIEAMWASEVQCIRYRGEETAILQRLGEAELVGLADNPRARNYPPIRKDRVVFSLRAGSIEETPPRMAEAFRAYLAGLDRFEVRRGLFRRSKILFSWYQRHFHAVTFARSNSGEPMALLAPASRAALPGVARTVDGWLKTEARAVDIRWHSRSSLHHGNAGSTSPL